MSKISPLAYIHPDAVIGENVEIGPFVYIDHNVVIGDNNVIMPNANILYGSRIGNNNTIFPGAVIGAIPQDLKFRGEETTAEVGNNNTIREADLTFLTKSEKALQVIRTSPIRLKFRMQRVLPIRKRLCTT